MYRSDIVLLFIGSKGSPFAAKGTGGGCVCSVWACRWIATDTADDRDECYDCYNGDDEEDDES